MRKKQSINETEGKKEEEKFGRGRTSKIHKCNDSIMGCIVFPQNPYVET